MLVGLDPLRDRRQRFQVRGGRLLWREDKKKQSNQSAVTCTELHRLLQDRDRDDDSIQLLHLAVRYRNTVADARRAQILTLEELLVQRPSAADDSLLDHSFRERQEGRSLIASREFREDQLGPGEGRQFHGANLHYS